MDFINFTAMSPQILVFLVITASLFLFIWNKWRYDLVSLMAFLAVIILGVLSTEEAFQGFTHPAVIIVASMFIISRALVSSGIIEMIVRRFTRLDRHPVVQLFVLLILTTLFSAFMNNVGALAFVMPIAIHMARRSSVSPAMFLLPLAFASHLGGYLTLIGTPRNILISTFRQEAVGEPFLMFDFAYAGVGIVIIGLLFLGLLGWRLIPKSKRENDKGELFSIDDYVAEVFVPEGSKSIGISLEKICGPDNKNCKVVSLIRDNERVNDPAGYVTLREDDILLLQSDVGSIEDVVERFKLNLAGKKAEEKGVSEDPEAEENIPMEAVVMPSSNIIGKTWTEIKLSWRYGVNLLAISRGGEKIKQRLSEIRFRSSDVLLLYGRRESVEETISQTNCVPLAERDIFIGRTTKIFPTLLLFFAAILLASFNILPLEIIFFTTALLMILFNFVSIKEAYDSIRWHALVLLGAMITVGIAFERTGGDETIANLILGFSDVLTPTIMLALVLFVSMLLSDFINATASAVLMAPVAIMVSQGIEASLDPFLMAVAIGVSSAFLTPMGHDSNVLVLGPGGYDFKDYIRVGLPLELLILVVSVPIILYFWPMY